MVTFHKVTSNTNLVNMNHGSYEKYMARFLWASGYSLFVNWSIFNHILCVLLFKDTLLIIYCWFINIELMPEQSSSNTQIFCVKDITAFLS